MPRAHSGSARLGSRISISVLSVTNPEDATGHSLGGLILAFVNRRVPSVRRLQATDNFCFVPSRSRRSATATEQQRRATSAIVPAAQVRDRSQSRSYRARRTRPHRHDAVAERGHSRRREHPSEVRDTKDLKLRRQPHAERLDPVRAHQERDAGSVSCTPNGSRGHRHRQEPHGRAVSRDVLEAGRLETDALIDRDRTSVERRDTNDDRRYSTTLGRPRAHVRDEGTSEASSCAVRSQQGQSRRNPLRPA